MPPSRSSASWSAARGTILRRMLRACSSAVASRRSWIAAALVAALAAAFVRIGWLAANELTAAVIATLIGIVAPHLAVRPARAERARPDQERTVGPEVEQDGV